MRRRALPGQIQQQEGELELDMTPMIDCVFLLLIFFIFSTKFPKQEGKLEASLPSARGATKTASTIVVIEITDNGKLMVNDQPYSPDELAGLLAKLAALDPEQPVIISGDAQARHQWIVDALNACAKANITRISFTGL
ncbi:MAG: biopolymer transporter ExbD [Planctomycetota bacterium]